MKQGVRLAALSIVATLCASCHSGDGEPPERPNVLLISLDTLRADHLSCYGYERDTSPTLDRLASEGVLFERTYSTTSWTLPSHMSLFTGLAISTHGVCDDRLWTALEGSQVPARGTLLAERLSDAGYATGGFYTAPYLAARWGFDSGFDHYERIGHSVYTHPEWSKRFEELREAGELDEIRAWMKRQPELFDDHRPAADEAIDAALGWIEAQETDFFCFLHIFDIHNDYVPPPPFDTRFTDPEYDGPIDGRKVAAKNSPVRGDMERADLEHLIALYDGEIAWVDSQLARLFARLEELGLADDTLIVVVSDHGEEFFEHGHKLHRVSLYEESLHVPLIFRLPRRVPANVRVAHSTGLVDVAPTIAALCGLEPFEVANGVDLAPEWNGESTAPRTYLSELMLFRDGEQAPVRKLSILRGDRHALIDREPGGATERFAYDLATDPREAGPPEVLDAEPAELGGLRKLYANMRRALDSRGTNAGGLSDEEREDLEAQGYTGHGAATATESERLCLDGCVWPDG